MVRRDRWKVTRFTHKSVLRSILSIGENLRISLFVAGAQKCGTTSLKNYLGEHPELATHRQREFSYFTDEEQFALGEVAALNRYFAGVTENLRVGLVAKYVSIANRKHGLSRLRDACPNCKLIYMVRNPIERAFSSWKMERVSGGESRDFDRAIHEARSDQGSWQYRAYIGYGHYMRHIEKTLSYYPPDQLKVFLFEDFVRSPQAILSEIFSWAGVEESFRPNTQSVHNQGAGERSLILSKVIRGILSEKNPAKQILRVVLPAQLARQGAAILRNSNKRKGSSPVMSEDAKRLLTEEYHDSNELLRQFLRRPKPLWGAD